MRSSPPLSNQSTYICALNNPFTECLARPLRAVLPSIRSLTTRLYPSTKACAITRPPQASDELLYDYFARVYRELPRLHVALQSHIPTWLF